MESTGYGNTGNLNNPLNNPGLSNTTDNALNTAASTAHSAVDSFAVLPPGCEMHEVASAVFDDAGYHRRNSADVLAFVKTG